MEEQEEVQEQPQKREPLLNRVTIIIIGAFLLLNVAAIVLVFGPRFAGGGQEGESGVVSALENKALIDLGRIKMSKPLGSLQESFVHCEVHVKLEVAKDRQVDIEPKIKQFDAKFKEVARRALIDAEERDLATENVAGVKNTIRVRFNELLAEDVIEDVVFGSYSYSNY